MIFKGYEDCKILKEMRERMHWTSSLLQYIHKMDLIRKPVGTFESLNQWSQAPTARTAFIAQTLSSCPGPHHLR